MFFDISNLGKLNTAEWPWRSLKLTGNDKAQ